ncbi:MAG: hypothetical protein EXS13_05415 [Planctomycetes bacterium]|nr:hypothetical protein [Planctomycetota bacterium]
MFDVVLGRLVAVGVLSLSLAMLAVGIRGLIRRRPFVCSCRLFFGFVAAHPAVFVVVLFAGFLE